MSAALHSPDDIRLQMLRYLDGTMAPNEVVQFSERLRSDTVLRRDFAELLLQQLQLAELGQETHSTEAVNLQRDATAPRETLASAGGIGHATSSTEENADLTTPQIGRGWIGWRGSLALAATIAFLCTVGIWFCFPKTGMPRVVQVNGTNISIERGNEISWVTVGTTLQAGDVLRTRSNGTLALGFGVERTSIGLSENSELKLVSIESGKRFHLAFGRLEAEVSRQRPLKPMLISTPNSLARVIGTRFTLTATTNRTQLDVSEGKVRLTDLSNGKSVPVPFGHTAIVAAAVELNALPQTGAILREYWGNLPGTRVDEDLRAHPTFAGSPDGSQLVSNFEISNAWEKDFGVRWRGYLHPPLSGEYVLGIAVADEARLYLSYDDEPNHKMNSISAVTSPPGQWQTPRNMRSFEFQAGRRYYFEILHKVGKGPAHFSVMWRRPDGTIEPIGGKYFSPYKPKL